MKKGTEGFDGGDTFTGVFCRKSSSLYTSESMIVFLFKRIASFSDVEYGLGRVNNDEYSPIHVCICCTCTVCGVGLFVGVCLLSLVMLHVTPSMRNLDICRVGLATKDLKPTTLSSGSWGFQYLYVYIHVCT